MERSIFDSNGSAVWHVYWQATPGRDLLFSPALAERIRHRLLDAHRRSGRGLLYYLLMPRELHLLSSLPAGDSAGALATGMLNVISRWVREVDGASGSVFAGRYRAQRIVNVESLCDEVRMLAWRPVATGLSIAPTNYGHSALRAVLGLCLSDGFHAAALLDHMGGSVADGRSELRQALANKPSALEILQWELGKGLVSARGTVGIAGPTSKLVSGAAAILVAASKDRTIDGALKLLERWVEVKLGLRPGAAGSSSRSHEASRARALVANLALRAGLCSASSVARHFGRAKATLSVQMAASRARAADQAVLAILMEQVVREAIALASHPIGGKQVIRHK